MNSATYLVVVAHGAMRFIAKAFESESDAAAYRNETEAKYLGRYNARFGSRKGHKPKVTVYRAL